MKHRRNWRTTLGGAVGVLGTSLIGVGVISHMLEEDVQFKRLCAFTAFAGFVFSGVGKAWTAFSAADAKELERSFPSLPDMQKPVADLPGEEKES